MKADNGQMEALKQLKEQYDCMTKGKIVTKNGIFLDNSFQPNADFYKVGFLSRVIVVTMCRINSHLGPKLLKSFIVDGLTGHS